MKGIILFLSLLALVPQGEILFAPIDVIDGVSVYIQFKPTQTIYLGTIKPLPKGIDPAALVRVAKGRYANIQGLVIHGQDSAVCIRFISP